MEPQQSHGPKSLVLRCSIWSIRELCGSPALMRPDFDAAGLTCGFAVKTASRTRLQFIFLTEEEAKIAGEATADFEILGTKHIGNLAALQCHGSFKCTAGGIEVEREVEL